MIRYALVREAKGATAFSAKDSHNFLDSLQLPDDMAKLVQPPKINGKPLTDFIDKPESLLQALSLSEVTASRSHASALGNDPRALMMRDRLFQAMGAASGISLSIAPKDKVLVPGDTTRFALTIANKGNLTHRVERIDFKGKSIQASSAALAPNQSTSATAEYRTPADAKVTVPHAQHLYDGREFGDNFTAMAYFSTRTGVQFAVTASTWVDVAPPVEIEFFGPELVALTPTSINFHWPFLLNVVNHENEQHTGKLVARRSSDNQKDYGDELRLAPGARFQVKVPARNVLGLTPASASALKSFNISLSWQDDRKGSELIGQRVIPVMYADAQVVPKLQVGYIRGFDFSLPNALAALGTEYQELSVDDVKSADLSKFTSVIVDNRVYESQPALIAVNQKLLDYAQAGGNLIVFYHKSDEWNPDTRRDRPQLAPYKLILGNERVTDENAPITFIEPDHPLLNVPNKMGQEDFKDWIQERGLYYPREWDPQFHALLQSNDPGEVPLKGGLLVANYGKGHYIYTSMVWYRELRGGVPGAYRMLANMISYGR